MFGYHGRYLRIDLISGTHTWVPLPESVAVWPATGMNCHAYVPSPRVSLSTPYTLQFPRGGTFAVVDH